MAAIVVTPSNFLLTILTINFGKMRTRRFSRALLLAFLGFSAAAVITPPISREYQVINRDESKPELEVITPMDHRGGVSLPASTLTSTPTSETVFVYTKSRKRFTESGDVIFHGVAQEENHPSAANQRDRSINTKGSLIHSLSFLSMFLVPSG